MTSDEFYGVTAPTTADCKEFRTYAETFEGVRLAAVFYFFRNISIMLEWISQIFWQCVITSHDLKVLSPFHGVRSKKKIICHVITLLT